MAAQREERELAAKVRRVAEQAHARRPGHDPSVRIRRVDPASLAPPTITPAACGECGLPFLPGETPRRSGQRAEPPIHVDGGCERARRRAGARTDDPATVPEQLAARAAKPPARASGDDRRVLGARHDQAIHEWLLTDGAKTAGEIAAHFRMRQSGDAIARLQARGLVEKTDVKRLSAGVTRGRPAAEYRAVEPMAERAEPGEPAAAGPSPARADPGKANTPGAHDRGAAVGTLAERGRPATMNPAPTETISIHEQLVVRYISALIGSIERASILRADGPPEHVYDRIERLLAIEDGAA